MDGCSEALWERVAPHTAKDGPLWPPLRDLCSVLPSARPTDMPSFVHRSPHVQNVDDTSVSSSRRLRSPSTSQFSIVGGHQQNNNCWRTLEKIESQDRVILVALGQGPVIIEFWSFYYLILCLATSRNNNTFSGPSSPSGPALKPASSCSDAICTSPTCSVHISLTTTGRCGYKWNKTAR